MALSGWLGLLDVKGGFCVQERRRFARRRKVEVAAIKTTEIKIRKKNRFDGNQCNRKGVWIEGAAEREREKSG